jgi:hypothetical protein
LEARNSGSESWYLSGKIVLGRVRYACGEQDEGEDEKEGGGLGELRRSWRVGWRPVGDRNWAEKLDSASRWRDAKVNIVGDGFESWPRTVKRPEMPISCGSSVCGLSVDRMPTSVRIPLRDEA